MLYQLSVIVPTLNEQDNVQPLFDQISKTLQGVNFEVVFVDDNSLDNTVQSIDDLIAKNNNIRLIKRPRKRGLSSACLDGFASCSSEYLAVIDADLQHDPKLLKKMFSHLTNSDDDIIVASRFLKGSNLTGLSNKREKMSNVGNIVSNFVTGKKLTDPLSGFFIVKSEIIDRLSNSLSAIGFKILLDIFASAKAKKINLKFSEIPCDFRERNSGESKLDSLVILDFITLLCDKISGKHISTRFVLFILVGITGVFVHMSILALLTKILQVDFLMSQAVATIIAMGNNFLINNVFTYRDRRIKGLKMISGFISFAIACSLGALINIVMATFLFERGMPWYIAGFLGVVFGSIWNYTTTSFFTWKNRLYN